jgi:hypothetical protein
MIVLADFVVLVPQTECRTMQLLGLAASVVISFPGVPNTVALYINWEVVLCLGYWVHLGLQVW